MRFVAVKRFGLCFAALVMLSACGAGGGAIDKKQRLHSADDGQVMYLGQALSGDPIDLTQAKPELVAVNASRNCRHTRASRDAKIVYIRGYSRRFGDEKFHHRFLDEDANRFGAVDSHIPVDIVITDTSQPIFLVIGSLSKHMWTLNVAPGVKIDGVAVSTKYGSSVANLPSDARISFVSDKGSIQAACFKELLEPLTVEDLLAANARVGYEPSTDDLRKYETYEANGKRWMVTDFKRMFGGMPDTEIYAHPERGFYSVLVGALPETPLAAQPITRVHYPDHMSVMWAPRKEAIEAWVADERKIIKDMGNAAKASIIGDN